MGKAFTDAFSDATGLLERAQAEIDWMIEFTRAGEDGCYDAYTRELVAIKAQIRQAYLNLCLTSGRVEGAEDVYIKLKKDSSVG